MGRILQATPRVGRWAGYCKRPLGWVEGQDTYCKRSLGWVEGQDTASDPRVGG